MQQELWMLLATVVGGTIAFLSTVFSNRAQLKISANYSERDLILQKEKLLEEKRKAEVSLEREKLEKLHIILSKISLENSQTVSYMQTDGEMELSTFRETYLRNCDDIHEAKSIADMYFPEMSELINKVYGLANCFWGTQERLLRIDCQEAKEIWHENLCEVVKIGHKIAASVTELHYLIAEHGKRLKQY